MNTSLGSSHSHLTVINNVAKSIRLKRKLFIFYTRKPNSSIKCDRGATRLKLPGVLIPNMMPVLQF